MATMKSSISNIPMSDKLSIGLAILTSVGLIGWVVFTHQRVGDARPRRVAEHAARIKEHRINGHAAQNLP